MTTSALRWATGLFCALLGALMLVAPHQFATTSYPALRTNIGAWGAAFFVAGAGLLGAAALVPAQPMLRAAAHVLPAAVLLLIAQGFGATGGVTGAIVYGTLGLATAGAGLTRPDRRPAPSGPDPLVLAVGASAALIGATFLVLPGQARSAAFDPVRPYLEGLGAAFLAGGLGLLYVQLRAVPHWATWVAHLWLAATYWAFAGVVALPSRGTTGVLYYGGFGLATALLPWLAPRLARIDPASLRTRLALALVAATTLPLLLAVVVGNDQAERTRVDDALADQAAAAATLARAAAAYVSAYRTAVTSVASRLDATAPPDQQRAALRTLTATDVFAFSTFDADGRPVARSDDLPLTPLPSSLTEGARRTGATQLVFDSPQLGRPVLAFVAPARLPGGEVSGFVAAEIETARVAASLARSAPGSAPAGSAVLLVGAGGRTIAATDGAVSAPGADVSGHPAVAALLGAQAGGSLRYGAAGGERLAGYAPVPGLDWGVVTEQPVADVVATTRALRDLSFGFLLLVAAVSAAGGVLVADRLARPLRALATTVEELTAGDDAAPLPRSGIREVAGLTALFAELRDRLAARTAERRRADAETEAARRRLALLAEAGVSLGASLDYEATLQQVARLAVPDFADWCTLDLLEADGRLRRVVAAHVDPAQEPLLHELLRRQPMSIDQPRGAAIVARTGRPRLETDVTEEARSAAARDAWHLQVLRDLGSRSAVIAPLLARGRVLGALSFTVGPSGRNYTEADVAFAEDLAARAASAIDNARLYAGARATAEALRQGEARKAAVLETALDAIITIDRDGRVVELNPAAERTFGYAPTEALGRELAELIIPERLRDAHRRGLARYLETGEGPVIGRPVELTALRRDGTEFPVEVAISPIVVDGAPLFTGFLRDVSDRKEVEAAHAHLAAIVQGSEDAIIGKTLDGTITSWNAGAERLYGYTAEEAVGRPISILIPPELSAELPAILEQIARGERVERADTVRVHKDGRRLDVSITVSPIRDAAGSVTGAAAIARDISDRKEAEAERARRLAQEEVVRAKDELVSIISHELRTPLVSLVGFTELMLARDFSEPERREFLGIMHREGQRLGALINDFLDLQRMESGRLQIVPEPTHLAPLLVRVVRAAGDDPDRPIALALPPDLPPVAADDDRIQQVLANLLSNARKYSPDGGEIRVSARALEGRVEVAVADRGLGIPEEALPQLFEKFFRVDNSDRREIGGTGLGLAICRQVIGAHGGQIWAESPGLGHGTTVRFTLPIAEETPAAGDVLVVEDDEGFGRLLETQLEAFGLTTMRVNSAEAALARLDEAAPRAVVLDLLLPGLQGEAFLARLGGDGLPRVPVVVVTVKDLGVAERAELERLGVVAVFQKGPAVAAQAARAVGGALDGAEPHDGTRSERAEES